MAFDYAACAKEIYDALGGCYNLNRVAHCTTRIRADVKSPAAVDRKRLEQIDGVSGVVESDDRVQVIIRAGMVNKVYDALSERYLSDLADPQDTQRPRPAWYRRMVRSMSDIFIPLLPAIIAAGLLSGLMEALGKCLPGFSATDLYDWLDLVSSAAITYLPVLVAISAAKTFGGTPYLGGVLGLILMHKSLLSAWTAAASTDLVTYWNIGSLHIRKVDYQGHILPVIAAVWLMCLLERWLHRHVPELLDLFVTPVLTVVISAFAAMSLVGPVFIEVENVVLEAAQALLQMPAGIGTFLCGCFYPLAVVTGVHHIFNVLEAGMVADTGKNIWICVCSSANVGMCMSCLAVFMCSRDKRTKAIALPASLSAALGITEPAIFGINLRFTEPMVCGMLGAGIGAAAGSLLGVYAGSYGVTAIMGLLITSDCTLQYLLMMAIAGGVAFVLTWVFWNYGRDKQDAGQEHMEIYAPVSGQVIEQEKIPDEVFSSDMLGAGVGIEPADGQIRAPFDGTVRMIARTGHSIAVTGPGGMEVLIHAGIDTVNRGGEGFRSFVSVGEKVHTGQTLLEFHPDELRAAGYSAVTVVILVNSKNYQSVQVEKKADVRCGERLMTVAGQSAQQQSVK